MRQRSLTYLGTGPDWRQALVALLGLLLGLTLFIALERAVTPRYQLATALDQAIPFIPLSWWAYVLFFPFVVVTAAYAPAQAFSAFKRATALAFVIACGCFLLFPESVPRPDPLLIDDAFLRERFIRLWQVDMAANGFPCLHVAVTCLAWRMLWGQRLSWLAGTLGLLICLSTLTVKQHTLIDVLGGLSLALLCSYWARASGGAERAKA